MNLRTRHQGLALAALVAVLSPTPSVEAQGRDVREIKPIVMLLVDSSGSMERRADCVCPPTQPDCTTCLPTCTGAAGSSQRSRWATLLEALTGSWGSSFACSQVSRSTFGGPDANYFIPHYSNPGTTGQASDGILDSYLSRIKFGLMTFDNIGTLTTTSSLVTTNTFMQPAFLTRSQGSEGDYSYGDPQSFWFPGCTQWHTIDNGAHSTAAPTGPLISVGDEIIATPSALNAQIQSTLLTVRPYGATPVAAMLTDLQYYLSTSPDVVPQTVPNGPGDPYSACRKRFAVLITDGYPNADMRGAPMYCDRAPTTVPTTPIPGDRADTTNLCPYDLPQDIAAQLCNPVGGECQRRDIAGHGVLDGLFVIGFALESSPDSNPKTLLDAIATNGGTGPTAFSADNLANLRTALSAALDTAAATATTRTVPAFAQPSSGSASNAAAQFQTGFVVHNAPGVPWTGVLERRRIECDPTSRTPVQQPVTDADRFQLTLNSQASRNILTVKPLKSGVGPASYLAGTATAATATLGVTATAPGTNGGTTGALGNGGAACDASGRFSTASAPSSTPALPKAADTGLDLIPFSRSLDPSLFGLSTPAARDLLVDWVRAENGQRTDQRFGDIYHSSPALVGPPTVATSDESYNAFMQRADVAGRPTVLYVGTNDGMLHAFVAQDVTVTYGSHSGTKYTAGQELWAFVPPMVFPSLDAARSGHVFTVDGTPLVKDVYFRRAQGTQIDASIYHTVLLSGFGQGPNGYFALDVTDPLDPKFLWQFTAPDMGSSLGTPAMGQVLVSDTNNTLVETGFAILQGGVGIDQTNACTDALALTSGTSDARGCPPRGMKMPTAVPGNTLTPRTSERCWATQGRQLFFVDLGTGEILQQLNDRVFSAPVTGGISLYTGDVGTIATRAYFTDQDGVMWRISLANPKPSQWTARPVFDLFGGLPALSGEPASYPPLVSTDNTGSVVVIQGTGDVDRLDDSSAKNRVVSLTENVVFDATSGAESSVTFMENWLMTLTNGQQLTGPLEMFNGQVFFSTFSPTTSTTNACELGASNICGLDYRSSQLGSKTPIGVLDANDPSRACLGPYVQQIVMGAKVVQEPSCYDTRQASVTDPYVGTRTVSTFTGRAQPTFKLIAQISGSAAPTTDGSQISQFSQTLTPPVSFTDVSSWAGRAD